MANRLDRRSERATLAGRRRPVVALPHPSRETRVVPSIVAPDAETAADHDRLLLRGELLPGPQAGDVDQHEVPCVETDVLHDALDLGTKLHELPQMRRDRMSFHGLSLRSGGEKVDRGLRCG